MTAEKVHEIAKELQKAYEKLDEMIAEIESIKKTLRDVADDVTKAE